MHQQLNWRSLSGSQLCQDIIELERDFKYNLFLLQLKDKEIERCTEVNRQLDKALSQRNRENGQLNNRIVQLQAKHQDALSHAAANNQQYDSVIERLNKKIIELKQNSDAETIKNENEWTVREAELKKKCQEMLENKERELEKKADEMKDRLNRKQEDIEKLKKTLEELVNENQALRNENREKLSKNSFRLSVLESEMNNQQLEKNKIMSDLQMSNRQTESLNDNITSLQEERESLQTELAALKNNSEKREQKLNEMSEDNNYLKQQVTVFEDELLRTVKQWKRFQLENEVLIKEIRLLKNSNCAIPDHQNFEMLKKQNTVLQEIIKNMKKDRVELKKSHPDLENKLKSLEGVVSVLKKNMMSDIESRIKQSNNV